MKGFAVSENITWTYKNTSAYLNYIFVSQRNPFDLNLTIDSWFAKEVCAFLNRLEGITNHNPDSLVSNAFQFTSKAKDSAIRANLNGKVFHISPQKKKVFFLKDNLKKSLIEASVKAQIKYKVAIPNIVCEYDNGLTLTRNIELLSKKHNLLPLEIYTALYRQDLLAFSGNNIIKITERKKENNMNECSLLRTEIGKAFNHLSDEYNLYFINDGTGTGKTHNAVMNFIEDYTNKNLNLLDIHSRRSLIFIAPQKNQFFVNGKVFEAAKEKNIPLLFPRPAVDFLDLNSKNFLSYCPKKNGFNSVKDFFDDVIKVSSKDKEKITEKIKDLYITQKEAKRKIDENNDNSTVVSSFEDRDLLLKNGSDSIFEKKPSIELFISTYISYRDFEDKHGVEKKYNEDGYKEELERAKNAFLISLKAMANFLASAIDDETLAKIFKNGSIYNNCDDFKVLFPKEAAFYKFVYQVIIYVLPFEVAKYINTVIYMSGDKSKTLLYISEESVKYPKTKVIKGYDLEDIVSGYSISQDADVLKFYKDSSGFGEFLETQYFIKNKRNFFLNNGIGFSIVEDEEHVLYNNFINQYTFKNITENQYGTQNLNVMHALAGTDRWIKNSKVSNRNVKNFKPIFEEKKKIVDKLFNVLKEYTVLNTDGKIEDFFNMVSPNDFGIFAKTADTEFITSVCDNIVSFNPKMMVLKDYLEQIKMVLNDGEDSLLIAKDVSDCSPDSVHYTVYDLFQIILCSLFVLKDASYQLKSLVFAESQNSHQNLALYYMLLLAANNKGFLTNLFSSSLNLNEDDPVNIQFSYFLTKIGFSFLFPDVIENREFHSDYIKIEPKIFIIKDLPEVGLLQMLNNPQNKVFLLSATRGFNNIFSGNYSDYFFKDMAVYCPGKIKVFRREGNEDNPMPKFIDERFANRNSIEVVKLDIDNSTNNGTVNALSFPVTSIELASLHKTDDLVPVKKTYDLVKKTKNKNYLSSMIYSAKKTDAFCGLWNPYHKAEIIGVLNSIVHAFEKNEHSIVMTLSNRFKYFLKDELFVNSVFKSAKKLCADENQNKVWEIDNIAGDGRILRIVLFDSELGRMANLSEHFKVDDNTVVVLVSSYGSAGTGLNLTLEDKLENEFDFSSIYFVSSPFYTSVKGDAGYSGLSNQLLIYKYFAHMGNKTIKDLSEGLASQEIRTILYREHLMEKVKSFMQSSGRIERRDFKIDTKIYFVENGLTSIFDEAMSHFNQMFNLHSNQYEKTIIANFSMLNKSLLKVARNYIGSKSLTLNERNVLEKETAEQYKVFNDFFNNTNGILLKKYRELNPDYDWVADFNAVLRNYRTPDYDFRGELFKFIKSNEAILKKTSHFSEIRNLYVNAVFDFKVHNVPENKIITVDYQNYRYSDYSNSITSVTDKFLFDYGSDIKRGSLNIDDTFLLNAFSSSWSDSSLTILPNLYMTHIIRGNVAEAVLENYLNSRGIAFNQLAKQFNKNVEKKCYELFDFYIIKGKTIIAVDTKNWSLYSDNGAKKTLRKLQEKIAKIKEIPEFNGYDFKFVYLNMFPHLNSSFSNGLSAHLSSFKDVNYINFIKRDAFFEKIKNEKNEIIHKNKKKKQILKIDTQWSNLI